MIDPGMEALIREYESKSETHRRELKEHIRRSDDFWNAHIPAPPPRVFGWGCLLLGVQTAAFLASCWWLWAELERVTR